MRHALLFIVAFGALITGRAAGQPCTQVWLPEFADAYLDAGVSAMIPSQTAAFPGLIIGGEGPAAGLGTSRVAAWNGVGLRAVGTILTSSTVRTLTYFDTDGAGPGGPELYMAGSVSFAPNIDNVARWTGAAWTGVGVLPTDVRSLCVFDDGGGVRLYAGVAATLRRWTGATWEILLSNTETPEVMTVFDEDGTGPGAPALFLCATQFVNSERVGGIYKYDGSAFTMVGGGVGPTALVTALHVADLDGPGPEGEALYVGGPFTSAGGTPANRMARWDGSSWAALDDGISGGGGGYIRGMASFDEDGAGPLGASLIVVGDFTMAGTTPVGYTARWRDGAWSAFDRNPNAQPMTVTVADEGGTPRVFIGGLFTFPGPRAARLRNGAWEGLGNGVNTVVKCVAAIDLGAGTELWAGGSFTSVAGGTTAVGRIAAWTGEEWRALGGGLAGSSAEVDALAVYDEGEGPHAFAGGHFSVSGGFAASGLASYDGQSWRSLGSGVAGTVRTSAVFDEDGAGPGAPALFVGGTFASINGQSIAHLARWDGMVWSAVGGGLSGFPFSGPGVFDLLVWDDGLGPALYVAGAFLSAGGVNAYSIAKWDGATWSDLDAGTGALSLGTVYALELHDDGPGEALYAGGTFAELGGVPVGRVAKWDGAAWSNLGATTNWGNNSVVEALAVYPDAGVPTLYAGGRFTAADGTPASSMARWNGQAWAPVAEGVSGILTAVRDLAVFDDGQGLQLYAAGAFNVAGQVLSRGIARWDGMQWSGVPGAAGDGNGYALAVLDDGSGPALYWGGTFANFGSFSSRGLARWNGSQWSSIGSISGGQQFVASLGSYHDGIGERLVIGGDFTTAGIYSVNNIARWNGEYWEPMGVGANGDVYTMAVYDDGSGQALYAAGAFTSIGGVPANRIARWDGASWSALGSGLGGAVSALAAFDDGTGPALYVGGSFTSAGGQPIFRIARWKDQAWSALGGGLNQGGVDALAVYTDGVSTALYVGGSFASFNNGGTSYNFPYLAKWDGALWHQVPGSPNAQVQALAAFTDSTGSHLFVGGGFSQPATRIARWDGLAWSSMGSPAGGTSSVYDLAPFQDAMGPALFIGGDFHHIGEVSSGYLARWGCGSGAQHTNCYPNCDGSAVAPALNIQDFACFLNRFAAQHPYANCDQSTAAPVLNVADFACFLNRYAAACQ